MSFRRVLARYWPSHSSTAIQILITTTILVPICSWASTSQTRYLAYSTYVDTVLSQFGSDSSQAIAASPDGKVCAMTGAYLMEINADGTLAYSKGLANMTGFAATASALAVDSQGACYVFGTGTIAPTPGAYQSNRSQGMVVVKFDPQGDVSFATYLDGSGEDSPTGMVLDSTGNVWLTGFTNSNDFPVTSNAIQNSFQGGADDAFVAELNPTGTKLLFGSYLGGNGGDVGTGIAVDGNGDITVAGTTYSTNFPTVNPLQATLGAEFNGFVTRISSAGEVQFSTYVGQASDSQIVALATDNSGTVYITGTASDGFPQVNPIPNQVGPGFVSKLDSAGSAFVYSTYFGQVEGQTIPSGIATDSSGNTYLAGEIDAYYLNNVIPLLNPIQSDPAPHFVTALDANGALIFSTFLGSGNPNHPLTASRIQADATGNLYSGLGVSTIYEVPLVDPFYGTFTPFFYDEYDVYEEPFVGKLALGSGASFGLPSSIPFLQSAVGDSLDLDVKLFNTGTTEIGINGVTSAGDFSAKNICPAGLATGTSCTITIRFAPTAGGSRLGSVTVEDDSPGHPHVIQLSGTGLAPGVSVTPTSLSFPAQDLGTTSDAQKVTLTNTGTSALKISQVAVSGDFAETNNCGTNLPPGACTISITFTPTQLGIRTGTLTITDEIGVQTVSLTGTGREGLGLKGKSDGANSATVTAGSTANYELEIGGAGMSGSASLTCSGSPSGASCSLPATVNVNATTVSPFQVSVSTTARSNSMLYPIHTVPAWFWATIVFAAAPISISGPRRRWRRGVRTLFLMLLLTSCGGNTSSGGSGSGGTAAGTYKLTVKAALGATTESMDLTLIVK